LPLEIQIKEFNLSIEVEEFLDDKNSSIQLNISN
jgi:hypothetical protein